MPTSTPPERTEPPADRVVSLLSHWLARHLDSDELHRRLTDVGTKGLDPGEAEVVEELLGELQAQPSRARLEPAVREALEAIALGF